MIELVYWSFVIAVVIPIVMGTCAKFIMAVAETLGWIASRPVSVHRVVQPALHGLPPLARSMRGRHYGH
jgi:hypothetical protein